MFFYKSYGLNIHSYLQLPELTPHNGTVDISIDFGKVKFLDTKSLSGRTRYEITPEIIHLSWSEVASFRLIKGRKIIVDPTGNVDENILREVLLGPVFAVLLYQRGNLVLHASAVNIDNKAVAFLGYAGYGKSTLSIEMYKRGYGLITDDILAVNFDKDDMPMVYPGFPMIKLESGGLPEDIQNFGILKKDSNLDKSYYFLENNFSTSSLPLKTIYIIKRSDNVGIEELDLQNALKELLPHSYCLPLFKDEEKSINLVQCAHIIENINVKVLNLGNSLEDLPEVMCVVEEDVS